MKISLTALPMSNLLLLCATVGSLAGPLDLESLQPVWTLSLAPALAGLQCSPLPRRLRVTTPG
jgi:hypothetical protein